LQWVGGGWLDFIKKEKGSSFSEEKEAKRRLFLRCCGLGGGRCADRRESAAVRLHPALAPGEFNLERLARPAA
jgi:hypothetical protein